MDNPDWAKVLSHLYDEQDSIKFLTGRTIPESHAIVSETGLSPNEIHSILEDMEDIDLIDVEYQPVTKLYSENTQELENICYNLSKKGFDIIHERELRQEQHKISEKSATLSGYLVLGVVLQALSVIVQQSNWQSVFLSIIVVGVLLLVWHELREGQN